MIRHYEASDWSEVCRVFDLAKPLELATAGVEGAFVPLAKHEASLQLFARSKVYVWAEGSAVRGFAGHTGAYIGWLFVEPNACRKGIGRALLRRVTARIDGQPWLWVMKSNHGALALYRSEGFEIVEEQQRGNDGRPYAAVKLARKRANTDPL